ncbi:MAG: hypothetical protein MZV70_45625 [Desulfobacterales bacterium]|nr:hypothetical protein [Desulfobacterales bacterium]
MRQRVMIAMALLCSPRAADRRRADHGARRDDPGADPRAACAELQRAARHGDHPDHPRPRRRRRASRDRVMVMYAGRIVEAAPIDELFADPQHPYTRGPARARCRGSTTVDEAERLDPIPRPAAEPAATAAHGCPFRAALRARRLDALRAASPRRAAREAAQRRQRHARRAPRRAMAAEAPTPTCCSRSRDLQDALPDRAAACSRRRPAHVKAVDGVSFELAAGRDPRPRRRVRLRQVDHSAARILRLLRSRPRGSVVWRGHGPQPACAARSCGTRRRETCR